MADGMLCVHCGWQETEHDEGLMPGDKKLAKIHLSGRKKTLEQCPGFTPEDTEEAERLAKEAVKDAAEQKGRRMKCGFA